MRHALEAQGVDEAGIARELAKFPPAAPAMDLQADDEGVSAGLFLAMDTQWRTVGMTGVMQGLDYTAIEPTARLLGVETTPQTFLDLKVMEAAAVRTLAERRKP